MGLRLAETRGGLMRWICFLIEVQQRKWRAEEIQQFWAEQETLQAEHIL
jgi:hypothetical protein